MNIVNSSSSKKITGVIHNFFRAYAIYIFHKDFSCHVRKGAGECLPHATKSNCFAGEKRDATFHLRVFRYAPDHAVFSAAVNKKKKPYNSYFLAVFSLIILRTSSVTYGLLINASPRNLPALIATSSVLAVKKTIGIFFHSRFPLILS